MSSWWSVNPEPKRLLVPTVKKKILTSFNLFTQKRYLIIVRIILNYIIILFNKLGFREIFFLPHFLLVHFNLTKPKLDNNTINPNINFGPKSNEFFTNKLLSSKLYLEYGSGSSTLLADKNNIPYYSIESDKNFHKVLKKSLKNEKNFLLKDFGFVGYNSKPVFFLYTKYFYKKRAQAYAQDILNYLNENNLTPDLFLVDGRYRILCALSIYKFLKGKNYLWTLIIDDYAPRTHYMRVLEKCFEGELVGRQKVFTKLKECNNIDELIDIYSFDYR